MAVQLSDASNGYSVPRSTEEALDLASSPGATRLVSAAAALAARRSRPIRTEELFVAALAIGMPQLNPASSASSASFSSSFTSRKERREDPTVADSWLYDWLSSQPAGGAVDPFIRLEAESAFPLPLPKDTFLFDRAPVVELSQHARAILGRASLIASRTSESNHYGVRHIVASLLLPDGRGANEAISVTFRNNFRTHANVAAHYIIERAMEGVPSDIARAWEEIRENPPPTMLDDSSAVSDTPTEPPSISTETEIQPNITTPPEPGRDPAIITLSGFTADSVADDKADPLGINPDVRAFARLICLEEATPPLSICLFGEWGSGKSTFMERLEREIARLVNPAKAPTKEKAATAPIAPGDDAPRFVENIVQIKFNAWHFADASLWASLTAVFFDQLRRGGYAGGQASDYQALIGKVAGRVRSLEAEAANRLEQVEDAKRKSDTAHRALDTAEKQLAASDLTLAWTELQSDFEKIRADNGPKLKEIGRRVYRDDLSADTKAFAAAVAEAASTPGRVALIGRVLVGGGWPTCLGVAAIVLIAVVGILLPPLDDTAGAVWFQRIAAWGAGSFAALGAVWQAFSTAKPILDGAWKYAKAVEDARAKLTKEVDDKRAQATQAAEHLKTAEAELAKARAPLSVYGDATLPDSPSTILRYFLFEDGDVRDYDKQVSIVSRARRSFEQLNSIVTTTRENRKIAQEARAKGVELTNEQKVLLEPAGDKAMRVPDRIVLYIDDLDRCTHDQVYAVLQAIHLLLAFELFVVVVGVDVRWIEGAVARHFEADAAKAADGETTGEREAHRIQERRRRALDYLEKIFQIPFWLRRLDTGTVSGAKGGSYGAYVKELLRDNARAKPGRSIFKSLVATGQAPPTATDAEAPLDGATREASTDTALNVDIQLEEPEDEFGAVNAALASMKLEPAEIEFLASPELGAVAAKSPRAVKRLINIYRIVRARLSDTDLDRFLGRSGQPPQFPIAALLGAIETGQPIEVPESLYSALALLISSEALSSAWDSMDVEEKAGPKEASDWLRLARQTSPALGAAFKAVDRAAGGKAPSVSAYREMAQLVRRYSFNRYD